MGKTEWFLIIAAIVCLVLAQGCATTKKKPICIMVSGSECLLWGYPVGRGVYQIDDPS